MNTPSSHRDRTLGLWLGVLGVAIFAVTLPATRLATGTSEQPQLSPWFVTVGRAALAGLLSAVFLLATRSPRPQPQQWRHLGWAVLGNALGYPLLLAFALRSVTASHAAVVTALLPLVTAAVAALVLHQRARLGFWLFAVLGSLLVVAFSLLRGWQQGHGLFSLEAADALLVGAVVALVSLGQGVAVVPASVVGHVSLPGVVYRSIQGSEAASWLSLIHRRFEQAPAVARYIQQVKQAPA